VGKKLPQGLGGWAARSYNGVSTSSSSPNEDEFLFFFASLSGSAAPSRVLSGLVIFSGARESAASHLCTGDGGIGGLGIEG
jgi:hypothetical protein